MPSNTKNEAIATFNQSLKQNGENSKYKNALDVVHKLVGSNISPHIMLDKKLITKLLMEAKPEETQNKEENKMEEEEKNISTEDLKG